MEMSRFLHPLAMGSGLPITHACVWVPDRQNNSYCRFYEDHPYPQDPAPVMPEGNQALFLRSDMEALYDALFDFRDTELCGHWEIPSVMSPATRTSDGFSPVLTFMSIQFLIRPRPKNREEAGRTIR